MYKSSNFSEQATRALASLAALLRLDASSADMVFTGDAPPLATRHHITAAQAAAIGAVALGVAGRWTDAGENRQKVVIDALQACASLHPAHFQRQNGHAIPALSLARELKADFYRTADDRWFFPIGSYPHLRDGVLALLDCPNTADALATAIGRLKAQALEDAFAEHRLPGVFARSPEEWSEHPQGRALHAEPLVRITRLGDSAPEAARPRRRPLDDLRVLDAAHVIAGPVVARTFAEHGADVLRVSAPMQPDPQAQIIDTGIGKRNAYIDLQQSHDLAQIRKLAGEADVFVQSWAPGSMSRRGLGPSDIAALRPGIVYVSVSCFGFTGPWAQRKGFEQLGQAVAGITVTEGGGDGQRPRIVPTYLLNDYLTGYLGAAGALAALSRRAREGGSWHVEVSLTRSSMWVQELGSTAPPAKPLAFNELRPMLQQRASAFGLLEQLGPIAQFSATPAYWACPPAPLGSSTPSWSR